MSWRGSWALMLTGRGSGLCPGRAEAECCEQAAARLRREPVVAVAPPRVPASVGRDHVGRVSTQQAFGRLFVDLAHVAPEVAARVVTVSPDVASSTNLGGWINRAGIWHLGERIDWFADDTDTLVRWRESEHGQHIELGIAEGNLVGLLAELGLTWARDGEPLLPIGTLYDPFVNRALEPWSFGLYAGAQSILVGTPSGVTLAPEGGAHQSIITPSVGLEQPRCVAWEPAFGQDLEWALLAALGRLARPDGGSAYFRLSTRPIDQSLAMAAGDAQSRRELVLAGGYPLHRCEGQPVGDAGRDGRGDPGGDRRRRRARSSRHRGRCRVPDVGRPGVPRVAGQAGTGRARVRPDPRSDLPRAASGADRERAGWAPAHAVVLGRGPARTDRVSGGR